MGRYGPAVLRLAVGTMFVAHGAQKLFGAWGGPGLSATAASLARLGLTPAYPFAVLVGVVEFCGGVLIALGGGTLWVSLALFIDMAMAVYKVHYVNGFFLDWAGAPHRGHGFEFHLVVLGALLSLVLTGPGALSVDEWRTQSAEARARGRARIRKV
jgi:putative oxidoreductase